MKLMNLICDGTLKAAILIAERKNIKLDAGRISEALQTVVLAGYAGLMKELADALEAHMGEAMYRTILNVGCNHLAMQALQASDYLPKPAPLTHDEVADGWTDYANMNA